MKAHIACPRAVHGSLLVRQHSGTDGRVTIGLCKNLLEVLKRKLHRCVLKLSNGLAALHHDRLVNNSRVAHRKSAKTISFAHNTLFIASSILSAWLKAMIDVEIFAMGSV